MKVLAISDGGLNRREERTQSIMGEIIFLSSKDEKRVSPLLWKAKSIRQVCKSAKTAETRSCEKTMEDAIYLARSLKEIYSGQRGIGQLTVQMVTDSKSLIESLNSTKRVEEKLMRPIIKWMKQCLDNRFMEQIRWCDTKVCLGDIFTKPGARLTQDLLEIIRTGEMIDLFWSDKRKDGEYNN